MRKLSQTHCAAYVTIQQENEDVCWSGHKEPMCGFKVGDSCGDIDIMATLRSWHH
jgi:hypothetical protein